MKPVGWKTYRTRFLVKAKQLSSSLSFVDHLGRQHCGRKGDYLVESFDGVISIAPRRIFEDIYVAMSADALQDEAKTGEAQLDMAQLDAMKLDVLKLGAQQFEELAIEELKLDKSPVNRPRGDEPRTVGDEAARVRRKLPQPCRDRRAPASRLLM